MPDATLSRFHDGVLSGDLHRARGRVTNLIGLVIERQMNGEVQRSYSRQGLSVRMTVPLTHERWPTQPPPPGTPEPAAR